MKGFKACFPILHLLNNCTMTNLVKRWADQGCLFCIYMHVIGEIVFSDVAVETPE